MKFIFLSDAFYNQHAHCSEILTKRNRPYVCLAVKIDNVTYAIPLRHNITHSYALFTSERAGLDYTKSVVIASKNDISPIVPQIHQKDFNLLKGKEALIYQGLKRYIRAYKRALKYPNNHHYDNIRKLSTLQYFNKYLGD